MPSSAEDLGSTGSFPPAIVRCAKDLIAIYLENPRITSIFAAQQRWLMAHAGFALYYGYPADPRGALYSERFVDFALAHKIASRNTAASFIREMLAYRFLRVLPDSPNRRIRLLEPTEIAKEHFWRWLHTHLVILDSLDGKERASRLSSDPSAFGDIQPRVALSILGSTAVRSPGDTFNLFNWANSGGVVMDYLISRTEGLDHTAEKVVIGRVSLREIHERFLISHTHLKRLVSQASRLGSVGWTEAPGRSSMWLSRGFIAEYLGYQAQKFAIIDAASEAVFAARTAEASPHAETKRAAC